MKMMKLALLGGAALAVTSAGAFADDLSALKAEIEALNSRVAQLEATPSVPAGYALMTVSEGKAVVVPGLEVLRKDALAMGDTSTVIGILPTADAPAGTEISWSGYARAALVYVNNGLYTPDNPTTTAVNEEDWDDDLDVYARGQIKVTGKTDTAVGEVGATVELRVNVDGRRDDDGAFGSERVYVEQAWGWWAMTPELTLGGGFAGSLGNIGYGYDGACNCYYTDNADVALNPGDTSQMRLSYASGPISFAIALEDASGTGASFSGNSSAGDDSLGAAAEMKYSGDTFNGEISGYYRNGAAGFDDAYGVGLGLGFALGDMASISLGTQIGQYNNNQNFWRASILGSVNLSDAVHAELAYGHTNHNYNGDSVDAILAGIYYDPVSQLTIGLEAEWIDDESWGKDITQLDLVTVFRF